MTQPGDRQRGRRGETHARGFFEDLDWGVIETGDHDLGTDLIINIRDDDRRDLAVWAGAQIKTGESWFGEPGVVNGQEGWWYRESDQKHANYWSNQAMPHLIVLQSEDMTRRYWAWLNRDTIVNTGAGMKVFVPESQPLDSSFAGEWRAEAERALKRLALDGARWNFDIASLPPTSRARFALVAAHLVAPHPNRRAVPLSWEQAVALTVLARLEAWERSAERFPVVPAIADAATHAEWGWRFAAAVVRWIYHGEALALEELDASSEPASSQITRAVVLSLALRDSGRIAEVAPLLEPLVVEDEYSADQAWLSVHLADDALERGDLPTARALAERASIQLAPVPADVTVSAIRAAATWTVFDASGTIMADVSAVVSALDTPTSWWRTSQTSSGLEAAVGRYFSAWAGDTSTVVFGAQDVPHNSLVSAAYQARLAGLFSQARHASSLQGRVNLSTKRPVDERALEPLKALLGAGDEKSLSLAIKSIARTGPHADLRDLVDGVSAASLTRSTSRAGLRCIQHAGAYASEGHARDLVEFLLESLEDPAAYEARFAPRYLVVPALVDALVGVREFLNGSGWDRVVGLLVEWAEHPDQVLEASLGRLFAGITLRSENQDRLAGILPANEGWHRRLILEIIGPGHEVARAATSDALRSGDHGALSGIRTYDQLETDEVTALVAQLSARVEALHGESLTTGIGFGAMDHPDQLARLSINHPEHGAWTVLADMIADPEVLPFRKRATAVTLARHAEDIPMEFRERFRAGAEATRQIPDVEVMLLFGGAPPIGAALDILSFALSEPDHPSEETTLAALLLSTDRATRRDVAVYLAEQGGRTAMLAALVNDPDPQIAANAVAGLARSIALAEPDPGLIAVLHHLASRDDNTGLHIAAALDTGTPLAPELAPVVELLRAHRSVRVRQRAAGLSLAS